MVLSKVSIVSELLKMEGSKIRKSLKRQILWSIPQRKVSSEFIRSYVLIQHPASHSSLVLGRD